MYICIRYYDVKGEYLQNEDYFTDDDCDSVIEIPIVDPINIKQENGTTSKR